MCTREGPYTFLKSQLIFFVFLNSASFTAHTFLCAYKAVRIFPPCFAIIFFSIASRAACIYRIRSTVNAFIKQRERYASGNERAMDERGVSIRTVA